ncbi:MAG TPA: alcohol dehydrogenase catalytic domain-containing protein [Bryobacteraceae bacterium]|nr:alcohol dehydrogenase catalytic domain-containing protein [Bryobacteraceae bacterium]
MRAVVVDFERGDLALRDVAEPRIDGAEQVLLRVRQVGVCGTDREIAAGRIVHPPPGSSFLTIGHEALAEVAECGSGVHDLQPGDWVAPIVRRPCPLPCGACASGRTDLCLSGEYRERGIVAEHGYFTEFAVDERRYLLRVPRDLVDVGILIEPLSVVEKAIELARRAHHDHYVFDPPKALVLGAGTIGILSAMVLRARGFDTAVWSQEDRRHLRVRLLEEAGMRYERGPADIVIEATGSAEATMTGLASMARGGVLVTLGAPNAEVLFPFRDLIVKNQAVLGSVNASPESFEAAVEDLQRFDRSILQRMIRQVGFEDFRWSINGPAAEHPKLVHMIV